MTQLTPPSPVTPIDPVCADLLAFIGEAPTPYHAVAAAAARLGAAGFARIQETDPWEDLAPGRYFLHRGDGSLLAFVLPRRPTAFRIVGAHTDSPNLRLKPRPVYQKEGYVQLGVEVYGGALLNSWLDRDLGVAGRVIVRQDGRLAPRLLRVDRPVLRVPQLAIHLDREVNDRGLVLNKQEHLAPIFALASATSDAQSPLAALCAAALGVAAEDIAASDLMLHDLTAPAIGGLNGEFVFAARMDNLAMSHAALTALLGAADADPDDGVVPVVALFDHEEVDSSTAHGAASPLLPVVLERLLASRGLPARDAYHRALAASLCVSADMAHAVHPNYPDRHEARHKPVLNGGPVIKINSQQRYATCARTAALFAELCRQEDVPVQHYAHRTDLPCGSTIGPITATLLGVRTVDVGNPMLSMHSARELGGSRDPALMARVLRRFLRCADPF